MNLVSIIIPYYKKKKYIKKTIKSIINQTYQNLEIIIIYDDPNTNDLDFIKYLKNLDSRIKLIINVKNIGAGLSRNKGIQIAKGKFIAFSSVEKVKFRHSVLPGEKITIHVEIEKIRLPFYKFKGVARVQNKVCSTLIFSAAEMSNK